MTKVTVSYVWEIPVRVTHWVNALCILTLCITGYFIGSPISLGDNPSQFVMGWFRFIHFVAGYTFAISVLARVYWSFVGNEYASWRVFFPWLTSEGRHEMYAVFSWYVFLNRKVPRELGTNAMAAFVYFFAFLLYLLLIATGFALYVQYTSHTVLNFIFGWITFIIPSQWVRMAHHFSMYFLIGFVINHIYSGGLVDTKSQGGVISSIFSGYKAGPE